MPVISMEDLPAVLAGGHTLAGGMGDGNLVNVR